MPENVQIVRRQKTSAGSKYYLRLEVGSSSSFFISKEMKVHGNFYNGSVYGLIPGGDRRTDAAGMSPPYYM